MGVYKCPVCEGRGTVASNFYSNYNSGTAVNTFPVTCKSCGGRGIVFDAEMFPRNFYNQQHQGDPGYMTFVSKGTCSNCNYNDRMVYTSNPPKWKCTLSNEWHTADYRCEHWCEQQQVYLQGVVDNISDYITLSNLNTTGKKDSTVEQPNATNTTDGRKIQRNS